MEKVVLEKDRSFKKRLKTFLYRHSRDFIHIYCRIRNYKERAQRKGECTFGEGCVGCCKTCPLETKNSTCSIYSIRPMGCRLYPMTEEVVKRNPKCTFYWDINELKTRNPKGFEDLIRLRQKKLKQNELKQTK